MSVIRRREVVEKIRYKPCVPFVPDTFFQNRSKTDSHVSHGVRIFRYDSTLLE